MRQTHLTLLNGSMGSISKQLKKELEAVAKRKEDPGQIDINELMKEKGGKENVYKHNKIL